MSNGKGGGTAKNGSGKGGGYVIPTNDLGLTAPGAPDPAPDPAPATAPYTAQRDFYGDGDMVNQPLPGYFKTFPAPGGNNYAPPPVVVEAPTNPDPVFDPNDPFAGMTAEQRAALASSIFSSGYMGATSPFGGNMYMPGRGQSTYNPAFLPSRSPFTGSLLDPNR